MTGVRLIAGWALALSVSAFLWLLVTAAFIAWPLHMLAALVVIALALLVAHELGPNGPRARKRQASENLRDIALRAAERDPHSATGRTVLGTPRDWSRSA